MHFILGRLIAPPVSRQMNVCILDQFETLSYQGACLLLISSRFCHARGCLYSSSVKVFVAKRIGLTLDQFETLSCKGIDICILNPFEDLSRWGCLYSLSVRGFVMPEGAQ